MHTFTVTPRRAFFAMLCLPLIVSTAAAQTKDASGFAYQTFTVNGATPLSVESINDSGKISGYFTDASGNVISYVRASNENVTTYTDPLDTTSPTFTQGGQINRSGSVAGEFYNTVDATYEGFIYKSSTGAFTTYQVPGQPQFTTTGLAGINAKGNLCGFVFPPPYTVASAFIDVSGTVSIFSVEDSATSACDALNDLGAAVGYYEDAGGVFHGWMRTPNGTVTTIDVPGAATATGTAPCLSNPVAGTVPLGINNAGYVSGHFWDASYNEHGFIMTPSGKFIPLNVPGAYQTSGGGLNDHEVVVGHFADSSCNTVGYIATP